MEHIKVVSKSTIRCPNCGFEAAETMPTDSCQFFYKCGECKEVLRPKTGDCCVYCSYGSVACPPVQLANSRCSE
ncbi:MAG TPA: GDCCVxC domain-containing (seleno)protein [Pyrinomonadaceae bacterium]|nr:GDCCVxC domain-containing (seleno)protein [Pyrinomonadaceae bacterium]